MDGQTFDRLVRVLGQGTTRRGVVALLGGLASVAVPGLEAVVARHRHTHHKALKRRRQKKRDAKKAKQDKKCAPQGLVKCRGKCVDTTKDPNNCGGCKVQCPTDPVLNAKPSCTSGTCGYSCDTGYADCDSDLGNGCEINIATDTNNCGGCGKVCGSAHTTAVACGGGECTFTCEAGYAHCSSDPSTGCETNTNTDVINCGGCGTACSSPNATAVCASGTCTFSCNSGWDNCDNNWSTGCEVNLNTNPYNCGTCGIVCTGGQTCQGGTCACPPGTCGTGCAQQLCALGCCSPGLICCPAGTKCAGSCINPKFFNCDACG